MAVHARMGIRHRATRTATVPRRFSKWIRMDALLVAEDAQRADDHAQDEEEDDGVDDGTLDGRGPAAWLLVAVHRWELPGGCRSVRDAGQHRHADRPRHGRAAGDAGELGDGGEG